MNGGTTGAYGIKGEIAPQMPKGNTEDRLFSRDTLSSNNVLKAQKSSKRSYIMIKTWKNTYSNCPNKFTQRKIKRSCKQLFLEKN